MTKMPNWSEDGPQAPPPGHYAAKAEKCITESRSIRSGAAGAQTYAQQALAYATLEVAAAIERSSKGGNHA